MMEKVSDKVRALPPDASYFSLEFFPPKTEIGLQNLQGRLSRMSQALRPLFVTVTWGAGGTTYGRSMELAEICQKQLGLTTCLHLTCTNMSKSIIDNALREAKDLGIRNILALRGDVPRPTEYQLGTSQVNGDATRNPAFVWAVDLVRYIRQQYGDYFCIGVAGYPEGHADESHPINQDPKDDMPYLVEKVKAGADFIITQLFYDVDAYLAYEKLVMEWDGGVLRDTIFIPGLMPIQRYQNLKRIATLSHAKLPQEIVRRLEPVRGNDEDVKQVGVEVMSEIIQKIKDTPSPHIRGFHFYTLNLEKSVSFILERCALIVPPTPEIDEAVVIDDSESLTNGVSVHSAAASASTRPHRRSSAHNRLNDETSSNGTMDPQSRATTLDITHGVGTLGREATWDDYPNGRFGDARSPAFGEIDGYGPSIHLSATAALAKWGRPTSRQHVNQLFLAHIRGQLDQLPWSEGPLNPETRSIERHLVRLIEKGWLSIASQPAVDGKRSADPVYGWGPPGGFVFQKAFVEFWVPADDWHNRLRPHLERPDLAEQVSWYASARPARSSSTPHAVADAGMSPVATRRPSTVSSLGDPEDGGYVASSAAAVNSVTWGVFPGKEIVTPTMVEEISFRAWAEEAYGIWAEWERCYPRDSPSREFLRRCRDDYVLVNVIGHAFRDEGALWDILGQA